MSEEWQAYVNDTRTVCKYGIKCYQKNPEHHKTYKHPPQNPKRKIPNRNPVKKRFKPGNSSEEKEPASDKDVKRNNDTDTKGHTVNDPEITSPTNEQNSSTQTTPDLKSYNENNSFKLPADLLYYDKSTNPSILKELFLVEMPPDFYQFYECLQQEESFEKLLASVGLELCGPYDLLLGKLPILDDKELYLIHNRYFYDPPEFQTILKKKGSSEYHIGYFRDDPNELPVFVGSNDSSKDYHIAALADNIFGAVHSYLQSEKKKSPFTSMACQKLIDKIKIWSENKFSLDEYNMKKRLVLSVTKSFHGAGIVVPYNKKTQLGYRPLVHSDVKIRALFKNLEEAKSQNEKDKILSELQPVITFANIAVDECDFGTGLEMGINLFCSGLKDLQPNALNSLCSVYGLLNREAFSKILQTHIKYRRRGPNMSVLSVNGK